MCTNELPATRPYHVVIFVTVTFTQQLVGRFAFTMNSGCWLFVSSMRWCSWTVCISSAVIALNDFWWQVMYSVMVDSTSEHLTTSPVFPCRQLTGQQSADDLLSKSGPVTKFEETNCLSSGASPWLSKEHGISNVKAAVKTTGLSSGYEQLHSVTFFVMILLWVAVGNLRFASVMCWCCHSYKLFWASKCSTYLHYSTV